MRRILPWAARLALLAVLIWGAIGALDPHHNAARHVPPADVVEHLAYGYLITLLTVASLPGLNPWLIGAAFVLAGAAFEGLQAMGVISGGAQLKDLLSNLSGVAAALVPLALGRLKPSKGRR